MATFASVAALFVYPLKSARGIAQQRARLTTTGFQWDRQWMLISPGGTFLSQRTHPQLARIVPEITAEALTLRAPGQSELRLSTVADGERLAVRVHRDSCIGLAQSRAADEWLSRAVGETVRLVRVPPQPQRRANPTFAGATPALMGFADGFPILVCNEASLADLNARMPQSIPMERFRPNIVLRGLPAWAEDRIDTLGFAECTLRLVKPCTRCTIPAVDQRTGSPSTDPAPVLRSFRFDRELLGVAFGENAVIATGEGSEVTLGATCAVSFDAQPRAS
ncbi:MAG TPA: MOSC N-terminal beta barrel domain-containing protein [Steroidobacteraceae bacterium]|nr:MOSC N-terminal beta barrel domain-containing protein [Steroidobacteraceae bacterium]